MTTGAVEQRKGERSGGKDRTPDGAPASREATAPVSWDDFPQPMGRAWLIEDWARSSGQRLTKVHAFRELLVDPGDEFNPAWILSGSVTLCGVVVHWGGELEPERPVDCWRCLRTLDRIREEAR